MDAATNPPTLEPTLARRRRPRIARQWRVARRHLGRSLSAPRPLRTARSPWLVWGLIVAIALTGCLLAVPLAGAAPAAHTPVEVPWWLFAALFYASGVRAVHVQYQREAHSFTLTEIPLVLGLFVITPANLIAASVVGSGLALLVHRRPTPIKLCFNVALFFAGTALAITVFRALMPSDGPLAPNAWLAAIVAALTTTGFGIAAVDLAIWLAQGSIDGRQAVHAARFGLAIAAINTCLALITISLLWREPNAWWLLVIPLALVAIAWRSYRAHIAEVEQRSALELLYRATRILHGGTGLEGAVEALLIAAKRTFRAEAAELVLFTGDGPDKVLRTVLGPRDEVEVMVAVGLDPVADALRLRAINEGAAFLAPALSGSAVRSDTIAQRPIRDAMVAPLTGEYSLIGTFVIANRLGALGTFRPDELRLFQALANHAGLALENGRLGRSLQDVSALRDRLRHQALHDSLTGLANRTLLLDRLTAVLRQRSRGARAPAILFIDLDDFKSVNDTIGHAGGDALLRAVATAIRRSIRPSDLGVRLAGDEFAVLVEDGRDIATVIRIAERIIDAIGRPFEIDGSFVRASASIGLATRSGARETAEELLHQADVAMYAAKSRGKGRFAVFEPSMQAVLSERQQLRDQLSNAAVRAQLALRYQPLTDLRSGQILGFEALLRWNHPTRGELPPAAFLDLADESGLIVPIGRWVLREACRQARAWSDERGSPVGVSVNIARCQLLQPDLAQDVARIVRNTGIDPAQLTLEFAEGTVMSEEPAVAARLRELKAVGVSLAIDGFGSGYSSVQSLGRYPVDAIKIARPLVAAMHNSAEDHRIIEAIVALGHSLHLQVVAEGIESLGQLQRVRVVDCDRGQGFFLSGPLNAAEAGRLLGLGVATAAA